MTVPFLSLAEESSFSDVDAKRHSWAVDSINFMVEKGVLKGYKDETFKPDNPVTKAEFAVMIYRLFNKFRPNLATKTEDDYYYIDSFVDIPESHWAYKPISELISKSWWGAYSVINKRYVFYPDQKLTRIGAVNMLPYSIIVDKKLSPEGIYASLTTAKDIPVKVVSTEEADSARNDNRYKEDKENINKLFPIIVVKDSAGTIDINYDDYSGIIGEKLASLEVNGIMTSYNDKFNPERQLTRAEAVTILHRLYNFLAERGELQKYAE